MPHPAPHRRKRAPHRKPRAGSRTEHANRIEAYLAGITGPGPDRRTPPCPYWEICGNCQLMQLSYAAQLEAKHGLVAEALRRVDRLDARPAPVQASVPETGTRRRTTVRASFGPGGLRMGLSRHGSRDLVDLPTCLILHPQLNAALETVRAAVTAYLGGTSGEFELDAVCDLDSRVGLVFHVARALFDGFAAACHALVEAGIEAVRLVDEHDRTLLEEGDPRQFVLRRTAAPGGPLETRFSLQSFTQLNFEQNEALVACVQAAAQEVGARRILDLYAGIGNYSLPLAPQALEVVAVESSMSSVADARDNAVRLGLANVRSLRGATGRVVRELIRRRERFDFVVLNPTRAGADGVVEHLARLGPRRICYVSCSPPTLARDLAVLARDGYRVTAIQPFDMFPQTYHVETVAVADRRS